MCVTEQHVSNYSVYVNSTLLKLINLTLIIIMKNIVKYMPNNYVHFSMT